MTAVTSNTHTHHLYIFTVPTLLAIQYDCFYGFFCIILAFIHFYLTQPDTRTHTHKQT